jgi:hypothetical protein
MYLSLRDGYEVDSAETAEGDVLYSEGHAFVRIMSRTGGVHQNQSNCLEG